MIPKILTLVRGLPGSGKSTFAGFIWNDYAICEADKFFYDKEGNYNFDGSKIKEAHKWCQDSVYSAMILNHTAGLNNVIVVSNTFTQEWEMQPYYDLAEKYGYRVYSLIVENRHEGVNEHGVPEEKLVQMKNRFEIKL